jgi:chromosomal replication initiation ATPase DnaA
MSYEQELKSTYAEARSRLWRRPLALVVHKPEPLPPEPEHEPEPQPKRKKETTREKIIRAVCDKYDVTMDEMRSAARNKNITDARHECFYRFRHEIKQKGRPLSLPEIGKAFCKDHTTVMHGINRHAERLENV